MNHTGDLDPYVQSLDREIVAEIGVSLAPDALSAERAQAMKANIKQRIKPVQPETNDLFLTIFSSEGTWAEIAPNVEKKLLNTDAKNSKSSFLIRMQPGSQLPRHTHGHEELCLILEGEAMFGDLCLKRGDFHLARKGSEHPVTRSEQGAVFFIQG